MKTTSYAVFPSLVTKAECENFHEVKPELLDLIYIYRKVTNSVSRTNRGGWQSPDLDLEDPLFRDFFSYLDTQIHGSLYYYKTTFKIANAWININEKGNSNSCHNHPGGDISGVLWVKIPKNGGYFSLLSPNSFTEHNLLSLATEGVKLQNQYHSNILLTPEEGNLLLFPSHLFHSVGVNDSDEDRVSIAFNLVVGPSYTLSLGPLHKV